MQARQLNPVARELAATLSKEWRGTLSDHLAVLLDRGHHQLRPGQVAVARVLARDWAGTGTSLFDTARVLAP